jgi:hypothetical protein
MSSGMGATGAMGRCFPLFKEYQQCLMSTDPKQCLLLREDYFECLHNFNRVGISTETGYYGRKQEAEYIIEMMDQLFLNFNTPSLFLLYFMP